MKKFLIYMYECLTSDINNWKVYHKAEYELDRLTAELMRNCHSIEKGLSINSENIRLGFGHAKQREMMKQIDILKTQGKAYYDEAVNIALATLDYYVGYHESRNYNDECVDEIRNYLSLNYNPEKHGASGGVMTLHKSELELDREKIFDFFRTRHSIRDFAYTPVDEELIIKAVGLAQSCPSACNRQGVRVYSMHAPDANDVRGWLAGTGGFEGHVQELLLITGKLSVYRPMEYSQYIVSASMFASYLALALHAVGLGACIIQRNVEYNKQWSEIRDKLNIPVDEQAICILGVGNLKENTNVPVSKRLSTDIVYKRLIKINNDC